MKPDVLILVPPQAGLSPLAGFDSLAEHFELHYAPNAADADRVIAQVGSKIRAVVMSGGVGLRGDQMRAMPGLEFVQTRGMGFDKFDLETATELGIVFANSRNVNFFSTAEHAMALLLMLVRDLRSADRDVHEGRYKESRARAPRPLIFGKRLGILGLGDVGSAIARRALGFDTTILYHNRNKRSDVPYEYIGNVVDLAEACDILMVSCPGGAATRNLVNREVLNALGPAGYLVNVGRGTVVETDALVDALHDKRIAGAALDVVDGEPDLPASVLSAPNLILTPHIGASSVEARAAGVQNALENLKAYFAGGPIKDRVI